MRLAAAVILLMAGLVLAGCGQSGNAAQFSGYIEGNLVLVGPDESGRLETLEVDEGDSVAEGDPLFALDSRMETAALNAAQAKLEQVQAALALSRVSLERAERLVKQHVLPQSRLDDARAAFERDTSAVAAARAEVEEAKTRLARRRVTAPVAGTVQEVYFRPGEIVGSGRPIVAILPPGNFKLRFYVPEPVRARIRVGTTVGFSCDGCPRGLRATVGFVSREAEYAPPIIFSREERRKLLYLVEARPERKARDLPIGQPVTVTLPASDQPMGS